MAIPFNINWFWDTLWNDQLDAGALNPKVSQIENDEVVQR
jgi:hypothetical protein